MTAAAFTEMARGLAFPEGPVAMPDGSVVLVEIAGGRITRVAPDGSLSVIAETGGGPNGAALGPDGALYVCNNGGFEWHEVNGRLLPGDRPADYETGRIERIDLATGSITRLYEACDGHRLNGPNDIVFDRTGGFYFTDFGKHYGRQRDRGAVYYAQPDGSSITCVVFPIDTPNGIALSPDETVLYVADSNAGSVLSYRIEAPGRLIGDTRPGASGPRMRPMARPEGYFFFDSMAMEADGTLAVATIRKAGITRISPDGTCDHVPTDDPMTTNICFGGSDLSTGYVTCSSSGRLLKGEWPAPGLPLNFLNTVP